MIFKDRQEAGIYLAEKLEKYKNSDAEVYALPRGGVVVAAQIARQLEIPLNVAITRKIGHPYNPEYAICAISEGDGLICNEKEKEAVGPDWLEEAVKREQDEIKRRRDEYGLLTTRATSIQGSTVILVDDGVATGLTMKAAIKWVKSGSPKRIVVAIPVVPFETAEELKKEVDELVALEISEYYLGSVGSYYINFPQVNDTEVVSLLKSMK